MHSVSALGYFCISGVLAACLIALLLPWAPRWGLVDHPAGRKQHAVATPLVGGLAIFLSLLVMQLLSGTLGDQSDSLLVSLLMMLLIGLADDARDIGHRPKFVVQFVAATVIVSGTSVHVTSFGDLLGLGQLELGKWAYLVTVVSFIGVMNAVNMIDGLDGLAGTQVLVPLLIFSGLFFHYGDAAQAQDVLQIAGAIAGFLFFNLRTPWRARAKIFMGDTGGLILGLLLSWYAVRLAGTPLSPLRPITAVWIIAIPLLDMGAVMFLRMLQGKSPFSADRQHLHYILLDAGLTVSQVVSLGALTSVLFSVFALTAQASGLPEWSMFLAFVALLLAYLGILAKPARVRRFASRLTRVTREA